MPSSPAALDRAQRIVDALPDAILIADARTVHFANPAAVTLLGAAHLSDIIGRPLFDFFAQGEHAALRGLIDPSAEQAASVLGLTLVRVDWYEVPVEARPSFLREDGAALVLLTMRDVTERQRHEAELRASEERLRLAFAGAQEGVWDWALDTGAVVYSRRWKEMLGYGEDEIPPDIRSWEGLLHPDDRLYAETLFERVQRGHQNYVGEFRLRHREGHYITVLSRGLPIREDGRVVRIVGTHLDITERKRTELALRQSEERLQLAFAGAQEGIWDWDLETDAVVYSSYWKQMLGYQDDEIESHISAWERLVHPDDRQEADRAHDRAMRSGEIYQAEFRLRHKEGHYVHVLSRGFPVRRDAGGPVVRIVGTHFDLTERQTREAEQTRNELLAHLVEVQEDERKRIARDMHDQFGEHLTALSLEIARLKAASAAHADVRRHADALQELAERLDGDVEHLAWQLRPTALDDLGLRAALANYLDEWSQRHGVVAELHTSGLFDHRLAPEVETALYRIGQEALNNAAKHARATRVAIILERRSDCVLLIVEDDGVGFEMTEGKDDRNGFGLVGMRERATLVGATLEVESSPGNGTTILVRMALAPGKVAATERV